MHSKQYFSRRDDSRVTVLGPCPGCDDWQLDYADTVVDQYAKVTMTGSDLSEFFALIEAILQEHLAECPHLRDLVEFYD